jgi:hypothetical protein
MNAHAPYEFTRDDARQRLRVRLRRPPNAADYIAIIDRQIAEDCWHFDIVYDVRAQLMGISSAEDIQAATEHVLQQVARLGPRGAVAVVSQQPDIVAAAQVYAYRMPAVNVQVFWDIADAERWLDQLRAPVADDGSPT